MSPLGWLLADLAAGAFLTAMFVALLLFRDRTWAQPRLNADGSVRRLRRSATDKWLDGVAGGIAQYYQVDTALVRTLFLAGGLIGIGLLVYLALWVLMPPAPRTSPYGW